MQQPLEDVVFDLEKDEVSSLIELEDELMIVKVIDGSIDKFISERDFQEKKSQIEKVIYERKARKAANQYVKDLMLDKNLTLNPPIFYALSEQLSKIIQDKVSDTPLPIFINDEEISLAQRSASEILDEVLATHQEGEMTVREFLNELLNMPGDLRPNVKLSLQLKNVIGVIVRNQYLAKQAEEMGLRDHPTVVYEAGIQQDEILSKLWLKKYLDRHRQTQMQDHSTHRRILNQTGTDRDPSTFFSQEWRIFASDSLRHIYPVTLDTVSYYSLMKQPEDTIKVDPVRIVFREFFNNKRISSSGV